MFNIYSPRFKSELMHIVSDLVDEKLKPIVEKMGIFEVKLNTM